MLSRSLLGGLRGGISIALARSYPGDKERDVLLAVTYGVVVFFNYCPELDKRPHFKNAA